MDPGGSSSLLNWCEEGITRQVGAFLHAISHCVRAKALTLKDFAG
jgi:hypothetical protein